MMRGNSGRYVQDSRMATPMTHERQRSPTRRGKDHVSSYQDQQYYNHRVYHDPPPNTMQDYHPADDEREEMSTGNRSNQQTRSSYDRNYSQGPPPNRSRAPPIQQRTQQHPQQRMHYADEDGYYYDGRDEHVDHLDERHNQRAWLQNQIHQQSNNYGTQKVLMKKQVDTIQRQKQWERQRQLQEEAAHVHQQAHRNISPSKSRSSGGSSRSMSSTATERAQNSSKNRVRFNFDSAPGRSDQVFPNQAGNTDRMSRDDRSYGSPTRSRCSQDGSCHSSSSRQSSMKPRHWSKSPHNSAPLSQRPPTPRRSSSPRRPSSPRRKAAEPIHVAAVVSELEAQKKPSERTKTPISDAWRKRGHEMRSHLVLEDEQAGGSTFVLNSDCSIGSYYVVAERVLEQFEQAFEAQENLSETYLVGNRLVKFLSTVLPTHKDYFSDEHELTERRKKSQASLVHVLQRIERLAVMMDEEAWNRHILTDLHKLVLDDEMHESIPSPSNSRSTPSVLSPSSFFGNKTGETSGSTPQNYSTTTPTSTSSKGSRKDDLSTPWSTPRTSTPAFGFEAGFEEEHYADCMHEPMLSPSSKITIKSPKGKHIVTVETTQAEITQERIEEEDEEYDEGPSDIPKFLKDSSIHHDDDVSSIGLSNSLVISSPCDFAAASPSSRKTNSPTGTSSTEDLSSGSSKFNRYVMGDEAFEDDDGSSSRILSKSDIRRENFKKVFRCLLVE